VGRIVVDATKPEEDARIAYLQRGFVASTAPESSKTARAIHLQRARMLSFDLGWEVGWRRSCGEPIEDVVRFVPGASIPQYHRGLASGAQARQDWQTVTEAKLAEMQRRQDAIDALPCPTARRSRAD